MKVTLLRVDGSDLDVVNAARVSYAKQHDVFVPGRDDRLIRYLARHGHWTPFGHVGLSLHVKAPIFVARQLVKHQVGLCVSGDTEITFVKMVKGKSNGTHTVRIADLWRKWTGQTSKYHNGDSGRHQVGRRNARVLNCETGRFETGKILDVVRSGIKPVFEITSEKGRSVKLTGDHRVYTKDGWLPLCDALGIELNGRGVATMSRDAWLGMNGRQYGGYDTYRVYGWMKARRAEGLDLSGIAAAAGCATHTIRKWLAYHDLRFDPLASLAGVNGTGVWNKGKRGYRLRPRSEAEREVMRERQKGDRSHFWRGGVTAERDMISAWTRRNSAACHRRHHWTCQCCGEKSASLEAHHIAPVAQAPELARDFDNLASTCPPCHDKIHANVASEAAFAALMRERGRLIPEYQSRPKRATRRWLRVHFEKITTVRYCGEEEVFDLTVDHPHHNFVGNDFVLHNCWNEVSRRYIDTPPEFFRPEEWKGRPPSVIKQGSGGPLDEQRSHWASQAYAEAVGAASSAYHKMLTAGVSPEMARMVLPLCSFTEWHWTGSLHAFARVCRLRLAPDAQAETREVAAQIAAIAAEHFPVSWPALMGTPAPETAP